MFAKIKYNIYKFVKDMAQIEQTTMDYCFWDVRSIYDLVFIAFHLLFATFLMFFIAKTCCKSQIYFKPGVVFLVYFYLSVWYITYLIEYIYGIAIYFKYDKFQDISDQELEHYSTIFESMDSVPAFILLGCIFFISSQLYSLLLKKSEDKGSMMTKYQKIFKRFLILYQIFRYIWFLPIVFLLIQGNNQIPNNRTLFIWSSIYLYFYFFDFVLCNISLYIVMSTARRKNQELKLTKNEEQKRKLKNYTTLLQFVVLLRLVYGIGILVYNTFGTDLIQDNCKKQILARSILYIFVGQFILHCLPVITILFIIRNQKKDAQPNQNFYNRL